MAFKENTGKAGVYYLINLTNGHNYTTLVNNADKKNTSLNNKLEPYFVTGFSDGEANFHVSVIPRKESKLKWRTRIMFQIGLHLEEMPLLLSIQDYFKGIGVISKDLKNNKVFYVVSKPEDILRVIIPHFNCYKLLTQKGLDYILWSKVLDIMVKKEHLTEDGLKKIISLKALINRGLILKIKDVFIQDLVPTEIPSMEPITNIPDPNWLVGFAAAESSFSASFSPKNNLTRARFHISQHSRDLALLNLIKSYLGVGGVYKNGEAAYNYEVASYKTCFETIIPFFVKNPLPPVCLKAFNFGLWKEIVEIMYTKEHLTCKNLRVQELICKLYIKTSFSFYVINILLKVFMWVVPTAPLRGLRNRGVSPPF